MESLSLDPWDRDFLDKLLSQPSPMTSLDSIDTTIWIMAADCSEDSEVLPDPPSGLFTTALYTSEETPLTWSALREANQEQEEFPPTCHFEANETEDDGKQQETLNRGTDPAESDRPLDDTMSKVSANDDLEPLDVKRRVEEDYEKTAEFAEWLYQAAGLIPADFRAPTERVARLPKGKRKYTEEKKYSPDGIKFVTDNDVLGGRGSGPSSHPGNQRYLKEHIGGKPDEYQNAEESQRKLPKGKRKYTEEKKYSPDGTIKSVTDNDVLGGRGSGPSSHPGNKRYLKEYIGGKRDEYQNAEESQREQIIENVLELVRRDGGEFLEHDDKVDSIWRPVPDRGFERVRRALCQHTRADGRREERERARVNGDL